MPSATPLRPLAGLSAGSRVWALPPRGPSPTGLLLPGCTLQGDSSGGGYVRPDRDTWLQVPCLSQLYSQPPASKGPLLEGGEPVASTPRFQPWPLLWQILLHLGEGSEGSNVSQVRAPCPSLSFRNPFTLERIPVSSWLFICLCFSLLRDSPVILVHGGAPAYLDEGVTRPCSWPGKEQGFPRGSDVGSVLRLLPPPAPRPLAAW